MNFLQEELKRCIDDMRINSAIFGVPLFSDVIISLDNLPSYIDPGYILFCSNPSNFNFIGLMVGQNHTYPVDTARSDARVIKVKEEYWYDMMHEAYDGVKFHDLTEGPYACDIVDLLLFPCAQITTT